MGSKLCLENSHIIASLLGGKICFPEARVDIDLERGDKDSIKLPNQMVGPILELEFVVETASHVVLLFLDCIFLSFSLLINFPNLARQFNGFIDL